MTILFACGAALAGALLLYLAFALLFPERLS